MVSRHLFHQCSCCTYVKARVWIPSDVADVPVEETTAESKPAHGDLDLIDGPILIRIPLIFNAAPSVVAQQHVTHV